MSAILLPIYIIIFIALIYFVGVRPQQKRRKELEALISRLSPGDEVVTVSGIYGTVTELEPGGTLLLEVAENTDIRVAQASIARLVRDEPAPDEADTGAR
jgi:preprotein translocase subunit YajC